MDKQTSYHSRQLQKKKKKTKQKHFIYPSQIILWAPQAVVFVVLVVHLAAVDSRQYR